MLVKQYASFILIALQSHNSSMFTPIYGLKNPHL